MKVARTVKLALGLGLVFAIEGNAHLAFADAAPQASAEQASDVKRRMDGVTFRYAGDPSEQEALRAAIHRAATGMNVIARPIARSRLRDRNRISPSVTFRFPPGRVEVTRDGKTFRTPDNFSPVPDRAISGERMQVKQGIRGGHVVQVFTADEGERRDEFIPSADGSRMTLRVTVRSPRLREPLQYQLTYAR